MLDQLTGPQLMEWEAYSAIEPYGSFMDDYRTGLICSTLVNVLISMFSKKRLVTTPADFMPNLDSKDKKKPEPKRQSVDEMKEILYAIAGGKSNGVGDTNSRIGS